MGLLSWLFGQPTPPPLPKVNTILPDVAEQEIKNGRLPRLNTDTIFTQKGEYIHYIDKAILLKDKTKKHYRTKNMGFSAPGLFKGDRVHFGEAKAEPVEEIITEQIKGILYVTKKRVIYVNKDNGFDKAYRYLSAVTPYSNGIELQYGSTTYSLLVPDGALLNQVFKILN